jgi:uncharacterized protein (TIRG00374 family)
MGQVTQRKSYLSTALKWAFWLIVYGLGVLLIVTNLDELGQSIRLLPDAQWTFLLLAAIAEVFFLVGQAYLAQSLYQVVGIRESVLRMGLIAMASNFINAAVRLGGFAGVSIFLDDARRRGLPLPKVTLAFLLRMLLVNVTNLLIVVTGLIYLALTRPLDPYEVLAAASLFVVIVATTATVLAASQWPRPVTRLAERIVEWLNRLGNAIFRSKLVQAEKITGTLGRFQEAVGAMRRNWANLAIPFAIASAVKLIDMLDLYLVGRAYDVHIPPGAVAAGYGASFLGGMVAPTPGGVVIVETAMATIFVTVAGVPVEKALVIVLTFRLIDFWLPLVFGALSLRVLQRK